MEELKLTGNYLKGSRPILTFSSNFDKDPHWKLLKEIITQISVPHNESDKVDRGGVDKMTLVEVGPRFCLNPIKIFGGSFGGPTLFENPNYISPNQVLQVPVATVFQKPKFKPTSEGSEMLEKGE